MKFFITILLLVAILFGAEWWADQAHQTIHHEEVSGASFQRVVHELTDDATRMGALERRCAGLSNQVYWLTAHLNAVSNVCIYSEGSNVINGPLAKIRK